MAFHGQCKAWLILVDCNLHSSETLQTGPVKIEDSVCEIMFVKLS